MNNPIRVTLKVVVSFSFTFIIFLIPFSISDTPEIGGDNYKIERTATTDTICKPITETTEICRYECLDWDTNEEGDIYCLGGYETICRNNTITRQSCSKVLFSGIRYAQNSSGDWVNPSDVLKITKQSDDLTFHYNGIKGDFDITFETGVIYNDNYYSMYDVKQIYPQIQFNFPTEKHNTYRKYAVNISDIPSNVQSGLQHITLTYKSHNGFTLEQLKKVGKTFVVKNLMRLGFEDLLENNFNFSINVGERRIYIGNLSDKFVDNSLYLDPTVQLQDADSENLADCNVISGTFGSSKEIGAYQFPRISYDSSSLENFYIKFDISSFSSTNIINNASLFLYMGNDNLETGEWFNISSFHVYSFPTYNISDKDWIEGNSVLWTVATVPEMSWDTKPSCPTECNSTNESTILVNDGFIGWLNWSIKNMVTKSILNNDNNVSIGLVVTSANQADDSDDIVLYSKEYTSDTSLRPYLNIIFAGNITISDCTVLDATGTTYYLESDITDSTTSNCMDITANNITLDCQGYTIDGNDVADYGIRIYRSSAETTNVTIKNCTLTDWDTAGVYLYYANGNFIWNTTVKSGTDNGIKFTLSNANEIRDSYLLNNSDWDLDISPANTADCDNLVYNVTGTDNKPIVYYNDTIVIENWNNNVSQIILCDANNSKINNVNMSHTDVENNGLLLYWSDNTNISNSNFSNVYGGIYLTNSDSNILKNITANSNSGNGIYLTNSDSNILKNITIGSNTLTGLYIANSDSNNITNTIIFDNDYGIRFNANAGGSGTENLIYNNLFNQTTNVEFIDTTDTENFWNTTKQIGTNIFDTNNPYIGGNYWTNSSSDGYSDTCTDADTDGFCDLYYNVSSDNATSKIGTNIDYLPYSDEYAVITTALISPDDNYYSDSISVDFICSASSNVFLKNITVWHNASGTWAQNETIAISKQTTNQSTFNVSLSDAEYIWNCISWDNGSNYDWGDANYSIIIDATYPNASYSYPTPANGTRRANNSETINITYYDLNFVTCLFEWNGTNETFDNNNSLYYWETKTTVDGDNYTFRAFCNDSAGNINITILREFTENSKPDATSATINSSNPEINEALNCTHGTLTDAEGDTIFIIYEWYNNSIAKGINNSVLTPSNTSINDTWYCSITPWDGYENGTTQFSSTVSINSTYAAPIINWTNATTTTTGINSTSANPTNNNSWINITIQLYDTNSGETWYVYMCNTTNFGDCKGGDYYCNGTLASIGASGCRYNMTGLTGTEYTYYPQVEDSNGLATGSSVSNTFEVNHPPPEANLSRPVNDTYFNVNYTLLNYTGSDPDGDTLNYSVYGGTDVSTLDLIYNGTATTYNYTNLSDGTYFWRVWAKDQHGYYSLSNSTVNNFTIDTTDPAVVINTPINPTSTSSTTITTNISSSDTNLDTCLYDILYRDTNSVYRANTTYTCNDTFVVSMIVYSGGYLLRAFSNDSATNIGYDDVNVTINVPSPGGGGGGAPKKIIPPNITVEEIAELCGNKICETDIGETPWTCPEDCFTKIFELDQIFCSPFPDCGNWEESWFINMMMFTVVGGIIYFQRKAKKARRRI